MAVRSVTDSRALDSALGDTAASSDWQGRCRAQLRAVIAECDLLGADWGAPLELPLACVPQLPDWPCDDCQPCQDVAIAEPELQGWAYPPCLGQEYQEYQEHQPCLGQEYLEYHDYQEHSGFHEYSPWLEVQEFPEFNGCPAPPYPPPAIGSVAPEFSLGPHGGGASRTGGPAADPCAGSAAPSAEQDARGLARVAETDGSRAGAPEAASEPAGVPGDPAEGLAESPEEPEGAAGDAEESRAESPEEPEGAAGDAEESLAESPEEPEGAAGDAEESLAESALAAPYGTDESGCSVGAPATGVCAPARGSVGAPGTCAPAPGPGEACGGASDVATSAGSALTTPRAPSSDGGKKPPRAPWFRPPKPASAEAEPAAEPAADTGPVRHKFFVGGLAPRTTRKALLDAFKSCGAINAQVKMENKKSRGFGFVVFEGPAPAVLEHTVDGRRVGLRPYRAL